VEPSRNGAAHACRVVPRSLPHPPVGPDAALVTVKEVGPLQLKGFHRPLVAYEVVRLKQGTPRA
jgi:hypothetical protein